MDILDKIVEKVSDELPPFNEDVLYKLREKKFKDIPKMIENILIEGINALNLDFDIKF